MICFGRFQIKQCKQNPKALDDAEKNLGNYLFKGLILKNKSELQINLGKSSLSKEALSSGHFSAFSYSPPSRQLRWTKINVTRVGVRTGDRETWRKSVLGDRGQERHVRDQTFCPFHVFVFFSFSCSVNAGHITCEFPAFLRSLFPICAQAIIIQTEGFRES